MTPARAVNSVTTEVARSALERWEACKATSLAPASPMASARSPTRASVLSALSSIVPRSFWNIVPSRRGLKSESLFCTSSL